MRRTALAMAWLTAIGSCAPDGPETLRIGVLLPYSADTGDFFRSMESAVEEANRSGGVRGRPVDFVLYDVRWDPDSSYRAFHMAVADGAVAVIGGLTSALATREADAALERRVPLVGCCSTSDVLTTIQPPGADRFFFRVTPPDRLQSAVIAERAYDRPDLACRRLGIVHVDDSYGNPLAASIGSQFESLGGTVAGTVAHPFFAQDFSTQVATLADGAPDCIVLVSNPDDGRGFRKTWTDAGKPAVHWLASDAMVGTAIGEVYADPHISDGILAVLPYSPETPSTADFVAQFTATYGHAPLPYAISMYDATAALLLAIEDADALDGDAIRDALFRTSNSGGTPIEVGELAEGLAAIRAGLDVDYRGFGGAVEFDACGDVDGQYALIQLDADIGSGYALLETGLRSVGLPSVCPP